MQSIRRINRGKVQHQRREVQCNQSEESKGQKGEETKL